MGDTTEKTEIGPKLGSRLGAVEEMVKSAQCIADIGCDHGYLSIALLKNHKASRVIACDIHAGPLAQARENAGLYGVTEDMDFRLGDGLKVLKEGESNAGVIAGMGGPLALRILYEGRAIVADWSQVVLQIQSKIALVRFVLKKWGFVTDDERMVTEDGKFYTVMSITPPGKTFAGYSLSDTGEEETGFEEWLDRAEKELSEASTEERCEYTYGCRLMKDKSPFLSKFLDKEEERLLALSESLEQKPEEESVGERLAELSGEMEILMFAKWRMYGK